MCQFASPCNIWQRHACLALSMIFLPTIMLVAQTSGQQLSTCRVIEFYGYDDCIELRNDHVRVVLCPAAGGRVLDYSYQGRNVLYLPEGDEGWRMDESGQGGRMNAGRFDIGPEQTTPRRPILWSGPWEAEIVASNRAKMTSLPDPITGVQLVREFELADNSSRLACTQTIINISDSAKEYCHWSRTFAVGNGVCLIPLTSPSRFPNSYVMYETGSLINSRPVDENIRIRQNFLEVLAAPQQPKLGMDSYAGWFAYLAPNDLLFVKEFPVNPDWVYNEVAGLTISIWYPDRPMCELEPIGPRQKIEPGERASFTETWYLLPYAFPDDVGNVDLDAVNNQVTPILSRDEND